MKRLFLLLSLSIIPSVHAVDYVQCETIRNIIARNTLQREQADKDSFWGFAILKAKQKYGRDCDEMTYRSDEYNECRTFRDTVWVKFKDEGDTYKKNLLKSFDDVADRLEKDFDKKGCYWF